MSELIRRTLYRLACLPYRRRQLEDVPGAWYTLPQPHLWAYAGGGHLHHYGNSQEAIDESIRRGFKVIEIDVCQTSDGVPVLSHFFKPDNRVEWSHVPTALEFKKQLVNGKFHSLTLAEIFDRYGGWDGWFCIDPFYYHCQVQGGEAVLSRWLVENLSPIQRRRVILQIYSLRQLRRLVGNRAFGAFHYVFGGGLHNGNHWRVRPIIPLLTQVGVRSVSFQDTELTPGVCRAIEDLRSTGIRVSVAGVNSWPRYREVRAAGVDTVNTMDLLPEDYHD